MYGGEGVPNRRSRFGRRAANSESEEFFDFEVGPCGRGRARNEI